MKFHFYDELEGISSSFDAIFCILNTIQIKWNVVLKNKLLIWSINGCGFRFMVVRSVFLQDFNFEREQLKEVQHNAEKRAIRVAI